MKSPAGAVSAMPRELEALRAQLDSRLTALEEALADPDQHSSLEQIILELARVATEEADAAARQAYLAAQQDRERAVSAVHAEGQTALENERATAGALRKELERAQAALHGGKESVEARERDLLAVRHDL